MIGIMDLMRDVYISTIVDKLSFLSMKIQHYGHLNLHNISVLSENFYCELLNLIYDLKLENTNEHIANAVAIDLIDNDNKCYVQVSAQKTPTKVQQSLEKLSQLGLEGEYRFYFLSIAKNAKSLRSHLFTIPKGVVFDSKTDVLDVPFLLLKINTLSAEKLQSVYDYVCKELKYSEAQHLIPSDLVHVIKILSQRMLTCNRGGFDKTKAATIQAKLDYNRLQYTRSLVARHVTNLKEVAKAYDEYNQSGVNHRTFVLNRIISLCI